MTDTSADTSPEQTDAAARDEFTLMRLYVGDKSAEKFDRLYRAYEETGHVIGWSWPAFLLGPIWLFYRRLDIEGAVLLSVMAVLVLISPTLGLVGFLLHILYTVFANQYFLYRAERRIYAIEQQATPDAARDTLIRQRGSVSMRGAVAGGMLTVGIFAGLAAGPTWASIDRLKNLLPTASRAALPACTAPQIKNTVQRMIVSQLASLNIPTAGIETSGYAEISASGEERSCTMTLTGGGQTASYKVRILWRDSSRKGYRVQLAPM